MVCRPWSKKQRPDRILIQQNETQEDLRHLLSMKETIFIKKYKEKWKDLETYLSKGGASDPDYLSSLYVQLTDDLSYAKTHYPDSKVTVYLNQLSSKIHGEIYKNKKENRRRFITFWSEEVPLVIYKRRGAVFVSLIGFILAFLIGWVSGANDEGFVRLILSDGYVDMTKQYIEQGNPMGVYGDMGEGNMFVYITLNNIYVCIMFFALGLLLGLGSLYKVFETGIMLGAFLFMFYEANLTAEALMAIWMHGVIEITVCIFSGAAGIVLGTSWMFPGTYTRSASLLRGAKDGLKILFGLVPFLVIAGFIESFVTRHSTNTLLSLTVIILSLGFVLSYLVIYPYIIGRRSKKIKMEGFQYGYQYPEYRIKIAVGIMWLVGGIVASLVTLSAGWGVGLLFVGAIGTGIVKIIQGLSEWSNRTNAKRMAEQKDNPTPLRNNFTMVTQNKKTPSYKWNINIGIGVIVVGLITTIASFSVGFFYIPVIFIFMGLLLVVRGYWDKAKQENKTNA
jgi:uncharacterized membrane protein SpoIIM required for sporulation